nr:peptidylprolyl isomerase [Saprospiraceae bacterium]
MRYFGLLLVLVLVSACSRPTAQFTIDSEKKTAPAEMDFVNQSEEAEEYLWDFGDGNFSTEPNPNHRYTHSGNYMVTLRASKGNKQSEKEKMVQILPPSICLIEIETEYGTILAQLYDETPLHRDNFLKLAEDGFYDGLLFHRVINGFMLQGGDPDSRDAEEGARLGMGGPGYQIDAEINNQFVHHKGALAAARMGDAVNPQKKSSGSQFYIVHGNQVTEQVLKSTEARSGFNYSPDQIAIYEELGGTPFLDGSYTVFGRVISGMEVIDKIAETPTDQADRPKKDIKMQVRIIK